MRRAVAVVLLSLLAGCAALGGGAAPETLTPAPVPEATPAPPAGVAPDRLVDASALARVHTAALRNSSYTVTATWSKAGRPLRTLALRVERPTRYYFDSNGSYIRRETFATERQRYTRTRTGFRVWHRLDPPAPVGETYADVPGRSVRQYLAAEASTVERLRSGRYAVVSTAPPPRLRGLRNYTARAVVTDRGVVRRLTVSYTDPSENGAQFGHRFAYAAVGATTVDPPGWVQRWRARTGANATAAPGG